jgi:hypothetical protein
VVLLKWSRWVLLEVMQSGVVGEVAVLVLEVVLCCVGVVSW